jgi:hypothetical protein
VDVLINSQKYIFIEYICKYISIYYNINENIIELVLFINDIIQDLKIIYTLEDLKWDK